MRSRRVRERTDAEILASEREMDLLAAIAAGRVVRGGEGEPATSAFADYLLDGAHVRLDVVRLSRETGGLVEMPLSGPPRLGPRGARLLEERG